VAATGVDPLDHYLWHGAAEMRDASPLFDARRYAELHAADLRAVRNPLLHYVENGGSRDALAKQTRLTIERAELFDSAWYLERYPDVAATGVDPLDHYLWRGAAEMRDPSPLFDARRYAELHAADLRAVRNPLLHYVENGGSQPDHLVAIRLLSEVANLDPDLASLERWALLLPFAIREPRNDTASVAWKGLFASLDRPYKRIIFVSSPIIAGADSVAANSVRAIVERHGADSFLLVATDSSRMEAADWPTDEIHVRILSDYGSELAPSERIELISWLIRALKPKSILNINSVACWELVKSQGAALSTFCDLYATLSWRDCQADSEAINLTDKYFCSTLPFMRRIYFDNKAFVNDLVARHSVPPSFLSRLTVAYQPAPIITKPRQSRDLSETPFLVMSAGRLCGQKNVGLLIDIAKLDERYRYEFFGSSEPAYVNILTEMSKSTANASVHKSSAPFEKLWTKTFGAFLYTTLSDGLPNVLLSAAAAGLPIIAPAIGGIGELVDQETGWLVIDHRNPVAYLDALNEIRRSPKEVIRRCVKMRERLDQFHTWQSYCKELSTEPSFLS
jgi:glycosyltransferase involved in cell wall biosynthesis